MCGILVAANSNAFGHVIWCGEGLKAVSNARLRAVHPGGQQVFNSKRDGL